MKKQLLSFALAGSMVLGTMGSAFAADPSDFTDIPSNWSRTAIEKAIENDLLNGSNGKIDADGQLTRAQLAAIIGRAFGATEQADLSAFADVPASAWYHADMSKAVAMGVFQGANGKLNPDQPITREEAFTVLARAFVLEGGGSLNSFADAGSVSGWAKDAVAALVQKGYVNGANGKLNAKASITRAEFAQIMGNLVQNYDSVSGTAQGNVVLRKGESIPAGTVIEGDLILADGLGAASFALDGVTVNGRILLRGASDVKLGEGSKADSVIVAKAGAAISVAKGASVTNVQVTGSAADTKLTVEGTVGAVSTVAKDTAVSGSGNVGKVNAQTGATGVKVTTPKTEISVDKGAGAVETGKGTVKPGDSSTTNASGGTESKPSSGGGSSGGGGSHSARKVTIRAANGQTLGEFEEGAKLKIDPANGTEAYEVTVSDTVSIPTPVKDEFTFVNWKVDGTTVTAQWKQNSPTDPTEKLTVKAANGQTLGEFEEGAKLKIDPANGTEAYEVTVSDTVNIPTPVKDGSTFVNWKVDGTTVTAQWKQNSPTDPTEKLAVKAANGQTLGEFEEGAKLKIDPANGTEAYEVTVSDTVSIPTPAKDGYTFVNWKVDGTTITAQWKQDAPVVTTSDRIYNGQQTAPILMDAAYAASETDSHAERTYSQISRAANDLRQDIAMVTGAIDFEEIQQIFADDAEKQAERLAAAEQNKVPQMFTDASVVKSDYAIIVGSLNDSKLVNDIVDAGKFDEAKQIEGKWEAYAIKEIENPVEGVKKALVIAGSDARGTIYGIYSISEQIGVSPWYWYSDVPVDVKDQIDVNYTTALVDDGPDVKYRGIFINDEEWSNRWASKKFPKDKNGKTPEVNYYRRLFEVMLRTKANTLWPAMHDSSTPFNTVTDDEGVPVNAKEANRYGIVFSTTHCDILLRTNVGEWSPWINANKSKYGNNTAYDFTTNEKALLAYWKERLESNKDFESILTLGIRGVHDGAFQCSNLNKYPGNTTADKKVNFMKDVIDKQRALIEEVYGVSANEVPQILIPYKEMGDVYNAGLDKIMAQPAYQDITLVWANDNYGNIRQTPNATEQKRSGGAGVYYHSSYMSWTNPKSYLLLNSISLAQISEQMHRAYDTGVQKYWMLNVGDLKPGDIPASFFMDLGWNINKYDDTNIDDYLIDWAKQNYGLSDEDAQTVSTVMEQFYQLTGTKKAEFFGAPNGTGTNQRKVYFTEGMVWPFSVTAMGDEGQRLVDQCNEMVEAMAALYNKMDPAAKDAFYEQMYYHVIAYRDIAEEYVYYWKNKEFYKQGRYNSAQLYAELSQQAVDALWKHTKDYWTLNDGKWDQVISPDHNIGGYDKTPQGLVLLDKSRYQVPEEQDGIGAFAEGAANAGSGTLLFNSLSDDTRYIDVFSRNSGPEPWSTATPDWIKLSKKEGNTSTEDRILVTIDWDKVTGEQQGEIEILDSSNRQAAVFTVKAVNKNSFDYAGHKGYVETNGYVMIEAEHYSENITGKDGDQWTLLEKRGQRGDAMKASDGYKELAENVTDAAKLVYQVYFEKAGEYNLTLYRVPTLNEGKSAEGVTNACRLGLGVNGTYRSLLRGNASTGNSWATNIMRQYESMDQKITVNAGWNTIEVYRSSPSVVFDRIMIVTETGAVADSLVGPEESPNNIAKVQKLGIGMIPAYVNNVQTLADVAMSSFELKTVEGIENALSAESKNAHAVSASVENGKVKLAAGKLGESRITVTLEDGSLVALTAKVTFDRTKMPQGSAYVPKDGRIVIDAVDSLENSNYAKNTGGTDEKQWSVNGSGLQVTPDNGKNWTSTDANVLLGAAPTISFQVNADTAKYYLSVNTSNPDGGADSFHVLVNGTYAFAMTSEMIGKDKWYNNDSGAGSYGALTNCSAWKTNSINTVTIVAREDGFLLNQIMLSTTKSESPNGLLECTPREKLGSVLTINKFENLTMRIGDKATDVTVNAKIAGGEGEVKVAVQSSDEKVATVSQAESGKFTITPVATGTTTVTVTASADGVDSVQETFVVTVADATEAAKAYQPNANGDIIINAIDALTNDIYAIHSDTSATYAGTTFKWVSTEGGKSIQLTPISDSTTKYTWLQQSDLAGKVPSLSFTVTVPLENDYYMSVFSNSPSDVTDSFHVVLNGTHQFVSKDASSNGTTQWGDTVGDQWFYLDKDDAKKLHLREGDNTLTIYGRESGVLLRQLMLSPEKKIELSGWQDAADE